MGPERKSRIPDEEANLITAYHEGGHTIVAHYTNGAHPLHKVTIIPRGPSLGHTACKIRLYFLFNKVLNYYLFYFEKVKIFAEDMLTFYFIFLIDDLD